MCDQIGRTQSSIRAIRMGMQIHRRAAVQDGLPASPTA
jgi:hypothetical protein